jgi:cytochrome c biogenesis factor
VIRRAGYFFAVVFAFAVAAFWKTYVVDPGQHGEPWTHVHAALMVLWFAVLVAQPFLIKREYRALHRALGRVSYVLVPALAASILLLMHARLQGGPVGEGARFYFLPFGMVILLVVPWALAVKHRRELALHARYMICTAFAVFDPVLGRVLYFYGPKLPSPGYASLIAYLAIAAILVALIVRERGRYAPYPVMLALTTLVFGLFATFARTGMWRDVVAGFRAIG